MVRNFLCSPFFPLSFSISPSLSKQFTSTYKFSCFCFSFPLPCLIGGAWGRSEWAFCGAELPIRFKSQLAQSSLVHWVCFYLFRLDAFYMCIYRVYPWIITQNLFYPEQRKPLCLLSLLANQLIKLISPHMMILLQSEECSRDSGAAKPTTG